MGQEQILHAAAGGSQGGSIWALIIPVALLALFWFVAIRPTRKRQRDMSATQARVEPGTRVMTGAGLYGTVSAVEGDTIRLEVAPGMEVQFARQAVVRIIEPQEPAEPADEDGDAEDADPEGTGAADADDTGTGARADGSGTDASGERAGRSTDGSVS